MRRLEGLGRERDVERAYSVNGMPIRLLDNKLRFHLVVTVYGSKVDRFITVFKKKITSAKMVNKNKIRIAFLITVPIDRPTGSMQRYRKLLSTAVSCFPDKNRIEVKTIYLAPPLFILAKVPAFLRNIVYYSWIIIKANIITHKKQFDLFHILDGGHAYLINFLLTKPPLLIATVHDIIPVLQLKNIFNDARLGNLGKCLVHQVKKGLQSVDQIIAVSNNTKNDILCYVKKDADQIHIVTSAIDSIFIQETKDLLSIDWQERRRAKYPYIFHLGNNNFYKNREGVLRIFSKICSNADVYLKMAGAAPSSALLDLVDKLKLKDRVAFIVDPTDDYVRKLYRNACLFLFPSRYEGFGWPPLEAMSHDCPVVCSNVASLPEIVNNAALAAHPQAINQMAALCLNVLSDYKLAQELIQRGRKNVQHFKLENMAMELRSVYEKVLENHDKRM